MTDKQIACIYLNELLWGFIIDHEELRCLAGMKLTDKRCAKISERIGRMAEKMREPLVDHLNRSGLDAT